MNNTLADITLFRAIRKLKAVQTLAKNVSDLGNNDPSKATIDPKLGGISAKKMSVSTKDEKVAENKNSKEDGGDQRNSTRKVCSVVMEETDSKKDIDASNGSVFLNRTPSKTEGPT